MLISVIAWTLMFFEQDKAQPDAASHGVGPQTGMSDKTGNARRTDALESRPAASGSAEKSGIANPVTSFRAWSERYVAAAPDERVKMVADGVELAKARRPILKQIIRDDPRSALANAVPMVVRQQLPPSILAQLETRLNGTAALRVLQGVPMPGEVLPNGSMTFR